MPEYEGATPAEAREIAKAFDGKHNFEVDPEPGLIIYNGPGTIRIFSRDDWKSEGVEVDSDTVWNRRNRWRLPLADFNERQLEVLRKNGGFVIGSPAEAGE